MRRLIRSRSQPPSRAKAPLRAFVGMILYFILSGAILFSFNLGLPPFLEAALSGLAAPAAWMLMAWNPVLAPLGLISGEAIRLPTPWAIGGIVLCYACAAAALAWLLSGLARRSR